MDNIKDSFHRVKQDIDSLKEEFSLINYILQENSNQISKMGEVLREISLKIIDLNKQNVPAQDYKNQAISTDFPTDNSPFKPLKEQNIGFSSGNEGVPADRQTNQQTNRHIKNSSLADSLAVLDSLDNLKKEIRHKFKRITDQEFLVFSAIYQIEEESGFADYKGLSRKLNLTESSIRDYVGKLIKKGIPVEKIKVNNKMIQLKIQENLKKIAPLPVILQLRDL